jgi:hypothetical protein
MRRRVPRRKCSPRTKAPPPSIDITRRDTTIDRNDLGRLRAVVRRTEGVSLSGLVVGTVSYTVAGMRSALVVAVRHGVMNRNAVAGPFQGGRGAGMPNRRLLAATAMGAAPLAQIVVFVDWNGAYFIPLAINSDRLPNRLSDARYHQGSSPACWTQAWSNSCASQGVTPFFAAISYSHRQHRGRDPRPQISVERRETEIASQHWV